MGPAAQIRKVISFGPFSLTASERLLMKGGVPLELGGRTLDILLALVSHPNQVVGKRELMAQVWPDVTVEEGSLRFHIAALRKALGDGKDGARYIATLAGRGYCFVAPISLSSDRGDENATVVPSFPGANLPARLTRMVGRADDVLTLSAQLAASRFVTIVGPGGVGKTTLAVAIAHDLLEAFSGSVLFVDLGALSDPDLVGATLASMLGLSVQSDDATASLIAYLRDKRMLVILDNCEHVIEAAATVAARIFLAAPQVHILATGREPLRVEGEQVHRLAPLTFPADDPGLTAAIALTFPAIQLFVERAAASGVRFDVTDADAVTLASICRRLDGVALAIELAAGRVGAYGLQQTAALLDQHLSLLWLGQRTAPPRQRTLQATLDWSYELLSGPERVVLRRLAVFVGHFTLEAALEVVTSATIDQVLVLGAIESLVVKSMVATHRVGRTMRYRLLDTTRAYARGKLVESGETEPVARRHAMHYREFMQRIDTTSSAGDRGEERAALAEHLGNIRAALEWSLADRGDVGVGVQLAASCAWLFIELSLLNECRRWAERALSTLDRGMRGSRWEMELHAGLGHSLMFTKSNGEQAQFALERGLDIAEELKDRFGQLKLLSRLHMCYRRLGYFSRLLPVAQRFEGIASDLADPIGLAAAQLILAVSHHLTGNQVEARNHLEAFSRAPAKSQHINIRHALRPNAVNMNHFGFHRGPQIPLARVLWLQGCPDQALQAASKLASEARPHQDPVMFCIALIWGVSVFRWTADWATVGECADRLISHSERHSLEPFKVVGLGLKGEVLVTCGEIGRGMDLLRESLVRLHAERFELYTPELSCAFAASLAMTGRLDQALATMTETVASVASRGEAFIMPELLRARGELLAQAAAEREAEDCFRESIALADRQSALSWRLRAATSFARLQLRRGRGDEARDELASTYAQFNEGFGTADLKSAKLLLDEIGQQMAP